MKFAVQLYSLRGMAEREGAEAVLSAVAEAPGSTRFVLQKSLLSPWWSMQSESSQAESSSPKLSTERSAVLISTAISRAPSASERGADDAQTSSPEYGKNEKKSFRFLRQIHSLSRLR